MLNRLFLLFVVSLILTGCNAPKKEPDNKVFKEQVIESIGLKIEALKMEIEAWEQIKAELVSLPPNADISAFKYCNELLIKASPLDPSINQFIPEP